MFSKELNPKTQNDDDLAPFPLAYSDSLIDLELEDRDAPKYSLRSYSGLLAYNSKELNAMHLNVRIYIIAVFMNDQKLKDEASKRCKDILYKTMKMVLRDDQFLPIVEEVLRNVDHDDTGLRLDFVDQCSRFICREGAWKELVEIFERYEPVALHVARHINLPIGTSSSPPGIESRHDLNQDSASKKSTKKAIANDNQMQLLRAMLASAQSALEEAQTPQKNTKNKADDAVKAKNKELKTLRKQLTETSKKLNNTEKELSDKSSQLVLLQKGKDNPDAEGRALISKLTYSWDECRGKGCGASFEGVVLFQGEDKKPVLVCKYCGAKHKNVVDKK